MSTYKFHREVTLPSPPFIERNLKEMHTRRGADFSITLIRYLPVNFGDRFSINDRTPSLKSSLANNPDR